MGGGSTWRDVVHVVMMHGGMVHGGGYCMEEMVHGRNGAQAWNGALEEMVHGGMCLVQLVHGADVAWGVLLKFC